MKNLKRIVFITLIAGIIVLLGSIRSEAASKKLEVPQNVKVSISGEKDIKVKWSKVSNAKKYTIYRATTKKGTYKKVGETKSTSFVNKNLTRGTTYYYKVEANNSDINSKKTKYVGKTVPTIKKALKEIKKALKDNSWLKKNVKMKETVFGESIKGYKQTLTFGKVKNKELVVVQAECNDALSAQTFLVGYYDGKVKAVPVTEYPIHTGHSGVIVDFNKGILDVGYIHMGYYGNSYYGLSSVKIKLKDSFNDNSGTGEYPITYDVNGKNVSKSKYNKQLSKYNKYNFKSIDIKLNSKNIDKYIK